MGEYTITIKGNGNDNRNEARSAQRIARKVVEELQREGHTLSSATVTRDGGEDNLREEDEAADPSVAAAPPGPTPAETR